jgi:hypothetical protein
MSEADTNRDVGRARSTMMTARDSRTIWSSLAQLDSFGGQGESLVWPVDGCCGVLDGVDEVVSAVFDVCS